MPLTVCLKTRIRDLRTLAQTDAKSKLCLLRPSLRVKVRVRVRVGVRVRLRVGVRVRVRVRVRVILVSASRSGLGLGGLLSTTSHSIFYSRVGQIAIISHCQPLDQEDA